MNAQNLSSKISLIKTKNNEINKEILNYSNQVEIHLFYEVEEIIKGDFYTFFGSKLDDDGNDWLKLIGLRCWAPKSEEMIKFVLPKLKNNEYESSKCIFLLLLFLLCRKL